MGRVFGEVEGYPEGSWFESRKALSRAGVHRPLIAGISGSGSEGADSIVLSGGYEDDKDFGDIIIYTGHGGRDPNGRVQVADQVLKVGNLALAKNKVTGDLVRVIRGAAHKSAFSPKTGYRYDGLFYVDDYWHARGESGFLVWRFRLVQVKEQVLVEEYAPGTEGNDEPAQRTVRKEVTTLRIVRDTKKAREIKKLYQYRCQVCGTQIKRPSGDYFLAEAAHIRPLGQPHNGPDTLDNLICLCPNHHMMFDLGVFTINDDLTLEGEEGNLAVKPKHKINMAYVRYHRDHYSPQE